MGVHFPSGTYFFKDRMYKGEKMQKGIKSILLLVVVKPFQRNGLDKL